MSCSIPDLATATEDIEAEAHTEAEVDPWATVTETAPEERLLTAIRANGSIGAKSDLGSLMGVSHHEVQRIIPRMIAQGVIVHDKEARTLALT
jgi:hypothetical protein